MYFERKYSVTKSDLNFVIPGLYTIITFPFLFALMFGDVCHGVILLAFAAWMVSVEKDNMDKTSKNEIWNIFFGGNDKINIFSVVVTVF